MKRAILYWLPVTAYMALVYLESINPEPEGLPDIPGMDKVAHFGAYLLMGLLLARAIRAGSKEKDPVPAIIIIASFISFGFGVLMEFFQSYIPTRSADIFDAIANGCGGISGAFIYEKVNPLRDLV